MCLSARQSAALALFGAGLAAGLGQVVLVRELLNIAAGNELTIGLMLAGWLLWGAVGAGAVSRLARAAEMPPRMLTRACLALLPFMATGWGMALARTAPLMLAKLPPGVGAQLGEVMGLPQLVVVSLSVVALAGAAAGALFALLFRAYTRLGNSPAATGQAYACDAVGHLTGGALAALLVWLGVRPVYLVVLAGLPLLWVLLALWPYAGEGRLPRLRRSAGIGAAAVISLLMFAWALLPTPRALAYRYPLLAERESPYGSWAVTRFGADGTYFHLDGSPVGCSPATPAAQYLVHFPLLQLPFVASPAGKVEPSVLLIGGGTTGALPQVLQYPVTVDYVELDPALIALARQYSVGEDQAALADRRVRLHAMDGRRWLHLAQAQKRQYEAVLLAVPDPSTAQVNRFYTADFLHQIAALLKPQGVFGLQIPSSDTYLGDELLRLNAVIVRTVQSVFPQVALLPGDPLVIAAGRNTRLSENPETLRRRLHTLGLKAVEFDSHVSDRLFPLTLRQLREAIAQAPALPLNTDARPIGYFYGQAYWVAQHSRGSWALFAWISRLRWGKLALGVLVLSVLALPFTLRRRGRKLPVTLAILGTGTVGMMLQFVLLFAFQVSYGYVYQLLGLLTGAFMVGLAVGGIGGGRLAARSETGNERRQLAAVQGALAVLAMFLPWTLPLIARLPLGLGAYVLFPLLMALVGLAVGAQFPLAAQSLATAKGEARAGAALYAADLCGAALGALVAGAALVPVLGVAETCLLAAVLSACLTGLLLCRR